MPFKPRRKRPYRKRRYPVKKYTTSGMPYTLRKYGKTGQYGPPTRYQGRYQIFKAIGFPEMTTLRMRYVDTGTVVSTLGVMSVVDYYANALYDPYPPVGGHQPMGFDQAMQYYQFATVLGSKITVQFTPNLGLAQNVPVNVGVYLENNTPYTDWRSFIEAGLPVTTILAQQPRQTRCTAKYSPEKFFGQTGRDITQFVNTVGSNCLRTCVYHIWMQSVDQASTSQIQNYTITIDYLVRLSNKNALPAS